MLFSIQVVELFGDLLLRCKGIQYRENSDMVDIIVLVIRVLLGAA
jgi:hypothetical protein